MYMFLAAIYLLLYKLKLENLGQDAKPLKQNY